MKSIAFSVPLVPGKTEDARRFAGEVTGPRRMEMDESRTSKRLSRETAWIQPTPMGDFLVVYLEGEDPWQANREFAASDTPFDRWFKAEALGFTGVDFSQPLPEGFVEVAHEEQAAGAMPGMKSLAVAFPIVSGQTEAWRRWAQEVTGPRKAELGDYLRRAGLTQENWYLQHTPQGDVLVFYVEGENPGMALQLFAASQHPFDRWNREQLGPIHGIDFSQPPSGPPPELGYDWQAGKAMT